MDKHDAIKNDPTNGVSRWLDFDWYYARIVSTRPSRARLIVLV